MTISAPVDLISALVASMSKRVVERVAFEHALLFHRLLLMNGRDDLVALRLGARGDMDVAEHIVVRHHAPRPARSPPAPMMSTFFFM
ncbi:hypothetical protein [Thauera sp. SDU_THAU2]|uniref:hypothetical protein n=1 Tax=Thauera sp. SDU_THAU2 TaxID=3136633 RepID=UPI00311DDAD4